MKKILITLSVLTAFLSSACTPARIHKNSFSDRVITEKVNIKRLERITFIGVPVIFGYDGEDKAKLWNNAEETILVPVGKREFFVRSNQADRPQKVTINLKKGEPVCLKTYPGKLVILKSIFIPWYWLSSAFALEKDTNSFCDYN